MRRLAGAALVLAALIPGEPVVAMSSDVSGMWSSADADDAVITLRHCAEGLCGKVVRQPRSGAELQLVRNFSRLSETRWTGGRVYNMNDGATYVVDIELLDAARLKVRGCWLGFCEIQFWRKVR